MQPDIIDAIEAALSQVGLVPDGFPTIALTLHDGNKTAGQISTLSPHQPRTGLGRPAP
ncbi:hypothetical protein [Agrobacterium sp.]|uniref:hypothetical protein n=1 Tax=Agrobacterium sp. TaxID=361 RepID=UPI0028AC7D83|nr:hypothetical protein [Agrobacterium sp.]